MHTNRLPPYSKTSLLTRSNQHMLTHRRRGPAAGAGGFSFASPGREAADAYDKWAERIKGKYNYFGRLEDVKYGGGSGGGGGAWTRRTAARYEDEAAGILVASGASSPELWQAGRRMVRSAEGSPARRQEAEAEAEEAPAAIARYKQEMLDLVKDVPENAYELSLIDMVDTSKMTKAAAKATEQEREEKKNSTKKKKKKKGTRSMSRSASMEAGGGGGLLLKMFVPRVPAALGGRRQSFSNSGTCPKVSWTRTGDAGEKGGVVEGAWWSKEYGEMVSSTSSSNSNGSRSSGSSSSSSSSIKSRIIGSCYPFVSHKGKQMGVEE